MKERLLRLQGRAEKNDSVIRLSLTVVHSNQMDVVNRGNGMINGQIMFYLLHPVGLLPRPFRSFLF